MPNQAQKMPNPNGGIKCAVNTCYFYGSGDHCYADKIEVQSPNARTSEMTDCATFRTILLDSKKSLMLVQNGQALNSFNFQGMLPFSFAF